MNNLKIIGKSMYGTKYSFDNIIPFNRIDISNLKFGDVIIDNGGNGMTCYVNCCYSCNKNYLAGTLIFCVESCDDCYKLRLSSYMFGDY